MCLHLHKMNLTLISTLTLTYFSPCSMLCLEQEIEQLAKSPTKTSSCGANTVRASPAQPPNTTKSAPQSPTHNANGVDVGYRDGTQRGFFEGLLGCLRPVWTILGKATQAELKQQGKRVELPSNLSYKPHLSRQYVYS